MALDESVSDHVVEVTVNAPAFLLYALEKNKEIKSPLFCDEALRKKLSRLEKIAVYNGLKSLRDFVELALTDPREELGLKRARTYSIMLLHHSYEQYFKEKGMKPKASDQVLEYEAETERFTENILLTINKTLSKTPLHYEEIDAIKFFIEVIHKTYHPGGRVFGYEKATPSPMLKLLVERIESEMVKTQ